MYIYIYIYIHTYFCIRKRIKPPGVALPRGGGRYDRVSCFFSTLNRPGLPPCFLCITLRGWLEGD